jgi:hypothetical protein
MNLVKLLLGRIVAVIIIYQELILGAAPASRYYPPLILLSYGWPDLNLLNIIRLNDLGIPLRTIDDLNRP